MDSIPDELIASIVLECNYKSIMIIKQTCVRFCNIINDKSLLVSRSKIRFPRSEGKAKIHAIPRNIVEAYDGTTQPTLSEDNILQALRYLINNEVDIIHGDMLYFFGKGPTGCASPPKGILMDMKIIPLENNYAPIVPEGFKVITNDVPLEYWCGNSGWHDMKRIITINLEKVRQQCLDNLSDLHTTFIYNNIEYRIKFIKNIIHHQRDNNELFRRYLLSPEPLLFGLSDVKNELILESAYDYSMF